MNELHDREGKLDASLARRLAAYSATAGVALAVAPAPGAQIVYHDIDPDAVLYGTIPPDSLDLDFDDDGVTDLQLYACGGDDYMACDYGDARARGGANRYYYQYRFALRAPGGGNPQNGILGYIPTWYNLECASRLSTGVVVGPAVPGQAFFPYAIAATVSYSLGSVCPFPGQEGYAGFRFVAADGLLHYGWIRLSATSNADTGIAYEYAYEAAPETPIAAGAVSDAALTGAVNQTTFPPQGGPLRYTFTVENNTTEPLPLDLWLHARRGAGAGAGVTRRFGAGTLPPRARVTRTVTVWLSPDLPPRTYDVRFKVGDFASGQFLTFQRFEITKAAPTGATGDEAAGAAAEPFAVAPVSGDLFAEADAALGVTRAHALGAPAPNPTPGRAELSLRVVEAQHVRVTVHDALGREVSVLHAGMLAGGEAHRLSFDGSRLPPGVYVVRAVGEGFSDTRVLSLTR